ncbi:MAG: hypothetical protein K2L09_02225, partial [Alistipes sp.]|nr:hypothetical protein [Alistipes sp.]
MQAKSKSKQSLHFAESQLIPFFSLKAAGRFWTQRTGRARERTPPPRVSTFSEVKLKKPPFAQHADAGSDDQKREPGP